MDLHDRMNYCSRRRTRSENIRKRWFRNWYVFEQAHGYKWNIWVYDIVSALEAKSKYEGTWYGPFWSKEDAGLFRRDLDQMMYDSLFH